jgi:archaellum component FlaF (FlaF/FlaG flagellin family)
MRYRVAEYTISGQTIALQSEVTIEDIRLIVNETQKKVICSSMQKSNVEVNGNTITVSFDICVLQPTDKLTIEIDKGEETAKEQTLTDGVNTLAEKIDQAFDAQAQIDQLIAIQLQTIIGGEE